MTKISELPVLAAVTDDDLIVAVDQAGPTTQRVAIGLLKSHIARPTGANEAGATRTLGLADEGAIIRCTAVGGCTLTIDPGLPIYWTCTVIRAPGAGAVQIDGGVGVSIEKPASAATPAVVGEAGGAVGIAIVDTNVAHLMGSLG